MKKILYYVIVCIVILSGLSYSSVDASNSYTEFNDQTRSYICSWAFYKGDDKRWYISEAKENAKQTVYSLGPINPNASWYTVAEKAATYDIDNDQFIIDRNLTYDTNTYIYDLGNKKYLDVSKINRDRYLIEGKDADIPWYFFKAEDNNWYIVHTDPNKTLVRRFSSKNGSYDWIDIDMQGKSVEFYESNSVKYVKFVDDALGGSVDQENESNLDKLIFLFVTGGYQDYTDNQLQEMLTEGNGFVLTHPAYLVYQGHDYKDYQFYDYYDNYISEMNRLVTRMHALDSSARIYITTPTTIVEGQQYLPLVSEYGKHKFEFDIFIDDLKKELGNNWTYVTGIYYYDEDGYIQAKYDEDGTYWTEDQYLFNPDVKNIYSPKEYLQHYKSVLDDENKKFIWSPYVAVQNWGSRIQTIHDWGIFDTIFIQPSYYFNGEHFNNTLTVKNSVSMVKAWVDNQSVNGSSNHDSIISVQMEIDDDISSSINRNEYNEYVKAFKQFINDLPISYYAGASNQCNNDVIDAISKFYDPSLSTSRSEID